MIETKSATKAQIENESEDFFSFAEFYYPGVEIFPTAKIATDLRAKIEKLQSGSRAYIVGFDGTSIEKDGYSWTDTLKGWLRSGCTIEYLLLEPNTMAVKIILKEFTLGEGLEVWRLRPQEKLSPLARKYRSRWETFHFAVFEEPLQLWIETCHEPGHTEAKYCAYYPEKAARDSGLAASCKAEFSYVRQFATSIWEKK